MPNKPTTLREEFEKEWKDSFAGGDMHNWERGQEVADWWLSKFTSHSTELLQKIEELETWRCTDMGLKSEDYVVIRKDALDEVISIISQNK